MVFDRDNQSSPDRRVGDCTTPHLARCFAYASFLLKEPVTRPLTFRYVGALLAIAGLLIAGQLLVQHALEAQQGDARVVNIAGKQRMLSQRLCMLLQGGRTADVPAVVDEWEATQRYLATRDNAPPITAMFAQIASDHRAMVTAARAGDAQGACSHADAFLVGMDRIVTEYEREARARVIALGRVELVLLGLALSVLALEGAFVFRPGVAALRRYLAERDDAGRQLVQVADREEQRLAHDLHDGVSQHLVGTSYLLEAMRGDANEPQRAQLEEVAKLLAEAIDQTRHLARGLYPPSLTSDGLAAALGELAARVEHVYGVRCHIAISSEPSSPARDHLYRIAREAVLNAAKHARGSTIDITLARSGGELVLCVRDDGVGIDATRSEGLGLRMIESRAKMLGAVLEVAAGDPRGTIVTCTLPNA